MKYKKFTKLEKRNNNKKKFSKAMSGEGEYIFQNNTRGDLKFPYRPNIGSIILPVNSKFKGDSYYLQFVKSNELRLIEDLNKNLEKKEENMNNQKLILDQPDIITEQGKVEHEVKNVPVQNLNEDKEDKKPEVLLNENPVSDGFIVID